MNWKTYNLGEMLNSDAFKKAQDYAKEYNLSVDSIVEVPRKELPLYKFTRVKLSDYGMKYNPELGAMVFTKSILGLTLSHILCARTKKFVYFPGNSFLEGKISADGMMLVLNDKKYAADSLTADDTFTGGASKMVGPDEYEKLRGGFTDGDLPLEWTKPVVVLDLRQIFDSRTYDGSFPVSIMEAKNVLTPDKNFIWCEVSDLIFSSKGTAPVEDSHKYIIEISELKGRINKLESAIKAFVEATR